MLWRLAECEDHSLFNITHGALVSLNKCACRSPAGQSREDLEAALRMWISLSLTEPVPDALLLLSRPMYLLHQVSHKKTVTEVRPPVQPAQPAVVSRGKEKRR